MEDMKIELSVILITYNSDLKKIELTLTSILKQKKLNFEIIIADDGSEITWENEIREIFNKYGFQQFKIIDSKSNVGTCANLNRAMQAAEGKFTKAISPGDLLYNENVLKAWYDYMNDNQLNVSFGDAVFYYYQDNELHFDTTKSAPVHKYLFGKQQNRRAVFVNYLLANDTILGASLLMRTSVMRQYLNRIEGHVKYAEDYMLRIMVYENEKIMYYPNNVIWYEYGTGISTSKKKKWQELLYKDFEASNGVILNSDYEKEKLEKRYNKILQKEFKSPVLRKVYKCILFPDLVYWRLKRKEKSSRQIEPYEKKYIEEQICSLSK